MKGICIGLLLTALCGTTRAESAPNGVALLKGYTAPTPQTWRVEDNGISNNYGRIAGVEPIWIEGEKWQGRPTRIFAWWGLPEGACAAKKVPAMVLVHGGGGTAFASWVKLWNMRGYAAIAMDNCGGAPRGERDGTSHPRHPWSGPYGWGDTRGYPEGDLRDQWPYQAVTAVMRCHSFLRARPEIDAAHIGLTGISWGGYLTSVVMGVDTRFAFAAPVYGCGWYDLNLPIWQGVAGGGEKFTRWIANWDAKNFIGGTHCPVLRCNGNLDIFYTMEMTRLSTAALPATTPSMLSVKHKMPHGHPPSGDPKEIAAWADHYLKGAPMPLRITRTAFDAGTLTAEIEAGADVAVSAELIYTQDVRPHDLRTRFSDKRNWNISPITAFKAGDTHLAANVPADAQIFFANVKTKAGLTFSTQIYVR